MINLISSYKNLDEKVNKILEKLPGLIICIIIALVSKCIGNFIPSIGGAPIAIFIGMAVGNIIGNKELYDKGTKFAESDLLSYSIVLLGGTLNVQEILKLGVSGISFIALQMFMTIIFVMYMGKKLGFSENFRFLMASGNAVCGSSAIGATAPVIEADDNEKGITITLVNFTGTVLMLLLPIIAEKVFHTELIETSAFIGGILQSVGQVVASGSLVNENVKELATIFKIVRIIFLVFVILGFGVIKNKSHKCYSAKTNTKVMVPWYVVGFFIMCLLSTMNFFSIKFIYVFKLISNSFEIVALAGIGMRVDFKVLIKQGVKSSVYILSIAIIQILIAILLIMIFLN